MVTKLILEPRDDTPGIIFDPENNRFEVYGKSLPEDVNEFYKPIIEYLDDYASDPNPETKMVFSFEYYNSASVIKIAEILEILEEIALEGYKSSVVWIHEDIDEMMLENGEDFKDIATIPFEIKSFKLDYK